jgi:ribosome-interacting GTPase 1
VPKQGAGQAVLLGASNVGKSALLKALTRAEPEVAPYPYTTRKPLPGMMMFEDAPIQLVDALAVERAVYESWMNSLVHNADMAFVVLDPAATDVLGAVDEIQEVVSRGRVKFVPAWWAVGRGEATRAAASADDVQGQELGDEELLARLDPGDVELPIVVLANKLDVGSNRAELAVLSDLLGDAWPLLGVSAETGEGLDQVREIAFRALRVIRVYAKPPGKPASTKEPILLPLGATVRDMARLIHKEIETNLRFARIWSERHFDGQRIPREAVLHDKDIVELNA